MFLIKSKFVHFVQKAININIDIKDKNYQINIKFRRFRLK